jgi:phosphoglycerate dehydrogenase-like enzyme
MSSESKTAVEPKIAIEPKWVQDYADAVVGAGANVVRISGEVEGLIWTDYHSVEELGETLRANPQLRWVQLPFAGVDAFARVIAEATLRNPELLFTSAKASYKEPVAEHALALSLALMRALPTRIKANSWGDKFAVSLYDNDVAIIGAGGIAQELIALLRPFRTRVSVFRRATESGAVTPVEGAAQTYALDALADQLANFSVVYIASALTDQTAGLFDAEMLARMRADAYLVNVARGPIVVTDALVSALAKGTIAGAATDVTDPEPLPDGHALWSAPNMIITPHTADTPEMVVPLLAKRIRENVLAFAANSQLVGLVDAALGY